MMKKEISLGDALLSTLLELFQGVNDLGLGLNKKHPLEKFPGKLDLKPN